MLVPTLIVQIVPSSPRLIFSARCLTLLLREAVRAGNPAPCLSGEPILPSVRTL